MSGGDDRMRDLEEKVLRQDGMTDVWDWKRRGGG